MHIAAILIGFFLFVIGDRLLISIAKEIGVDNILFIRYLSMLVFCLLHFLYLKHKDPRRSLAISFSSPFIAFGVFGTLAFSSAFLCSVWSSQLTTFLLISLSPVFGFLIERRKPNTIQTLSLLSMFLLAVIVLVIQGISSVGWYIILTGLGASLLWAFELQATGNARNFGRHIHEDINMSFEVETLFSACVIAITLIGGYILFKEYTFVPDTVKIVSITQIELTSLISAVAISIFYYLANIFIIFGASRVSSYISAAGFYSVIVFTSLLYLYDSEVSEVNTVLILLLSTFIVISGFVYSKSSKGSAE